MQEIRIAHVNNRDIPVLISDEKEALLAAKAAGRAIVGLWRPGAAMEELAAARYLVEETSDVTEEFLERVARRHLGLPWRICETERLLIREMIGDDYDEAWENRVGRGFGSVEEFLAYTKNQYAFYEFGFWALVEKATGELAGVAGLTVPGEPETGMQIFERQSGGEQGGPGDCGETAGPGWASCEAGEMLSGGVENDSGPDEAAGRQTEEDPGQEETSDAFTLELGYHIFPPFRRRGLARESCLAILRYGEEELEAERFVVRIREGNRASEVLARELGFR